MDARLMVAGEELLLLPERAAYVPRLRTLVVADAHLGLDTSYRALAVPLPGDATGDDLGRLGTALRRMGAERLVVLGDMFHAPQGLTEGMVEALAVWRRDHAALAMVLVPGNHDRRCALPSCLGLELAEAGSRFGPFELRHEPPAAGELASGYVLCGHVHPGVWLSGPGRQREKLRCFLFGPRVGLLPAFGGLTGLVAVLPGRLDRVFVLADGEVIEAA